MCIVYPDHIRVCSVGQPECSAIVFLIQLGLFVVQMTESIADLSALLKSLVVLWKLKNRKEQRLRSGHMSFIIGQKHRGVGRLTDSVTKETRF